MDISLRLNIISILLSIIHFMNVVIEKIIILTFFILLSIAGECQISIHGSYAIAAFCKDGIVMVADTRSSFVIPKTNDELAYFDTAQKLFKVHDFIISCIGSATINGKFIDFYIREYNKHEYTPRNSMDSTILDFVNFIKASYPLAANDFFFDEKIFIGRYYNKIPFWGLIEHGNYKYSTGIGFISPDTLIPIFYKKYSIKNTCTKNGKIAEKAILDYIKSNKKESSIGGPFMILKLNPNNEAIWIKNNKKTLNPLDMNSFVEYYRTGKLNIHFLSDEKEKVFDSILETIK